MEKEKTLAVEGECIHNWKQVKKYSYNNNPYFFCEKCLKIVWIDFDKNGEEFGELVE